MQQPAYREDPDLPSRRYVSRSAFGLTDAGLVGGLGSTFIRMRKGTSELAFERDCDRLVALMSVAANRLIDEAEVLPHVMAAANHWRRGDKALANLRLAFAKFPNVADQTSAYRVALAEQLLDNGWSSRDLLIELGLAAPTSRVEKYNPNHVPAGNGRRSGQFDFGSGSIVVAGGEDEKILEEREFLGETTPKEELEHGHPITPTTGLPFVGGRGAVLDTKTFEQLSAAARAAADAVGPGKGAVYGTAVHTEFKANVKALGRDDLHAEQSYLDRDPVSYGTPGSIRVDAAEGVKELPHTVYDLKTGQASLTDSHIEQLREHLPDGNNVSIHEVRP